MYKKLNRDTNARKALLRNLATNLILNEKIETTLAKAKVLRPFAEKLITKSKTNSVVSRRNLLKDLPNESMVSKLLSTIGPKVADRNGGYLRIIRLGNRVGDNALLVRVEFVDDLSPKKVEKVKEAPKEEPKTNVLESAKKLVTSRSSIKVTKRSAAKKEEKSKLKNVK